MPLISRICEGLVFSNSSKQPLPDKLFIESLASYLRRLALGDRGAAAWSRRVIFNTCNPMLSTTLPPTADLLFKNIHRCGDFITAKGREQP